MPNFAKAIIIGHIGGDVELKSVGTSQVANFSVAVNTGYGDKQVCTWYRVSVWGKAAESAMTHLRKGTAVCIDGELQNREFEGKNGSAKTLEINHANWTFAGAKDPAGQQRDPQAQAPVVAEAFEDDIPF